MNATTAYSAPTTPTATPQKDLEKEIKFSWRSVMRRWGENLKDDIDPALTGAKMALYVHSLPTWHREFRDGKMRSTSPVISGLAALVVGGTEAAAYYAGAQIADQQIAAASVPYLSDVPNIGYVAIGATIIATNTLSWMYEAFHRAKKTENSNVIMARIQRAIEKPTGTYDLTIADLRDKLVDRLKAKVREEGSLHRRNRDDDSAQEWIQAHLAQVPDRANGMIMTAAHDVFSGLVADGQLGKQYELTADLKSGPANRRRAWENTFEVTYAGTATPVQDLAELLRDEIKTHGGAVNVELFGSMTALYDPKAQGITRYSVKPNEKIWR